MIATFVVTVGALLWIPYLRRNAVLGYPLLAIYTISLSYVAGYVSFKAGFNIVIGCLGMTMSVAVAMMFATKKVEKLMDKLLVTFQACKCGKKEEDKKARAKGCE